MDDAWDQWRQRLATELAGFTEGEFLNTAAPVVTRDRGRGLFGRQRAPEVVVPTPAVNFLGIRQRDGTDVVLIESDVVETGHGGHPLDEEQRDRLREAGWTMPGDEEYFPNEPGKIEIYLTVAEADRAAELAVQTYRIAGVEDPAVLSWDRGS